MRTYAAASLALAAAARASPPPPNILLLMADQMRYDALTPELTPALAGLARDGMTLARAYTSTPSCTPARSALLTGLSPWGHGMLGYGDVPPAWPYEMPRAMTDLGYRTVSIGKNHFYNPDFMPNASSPPPSHGWTEQHLYDGLGDGMDPGKADGGEFDDYDRYFANATGGKDPLATGKPHMDWNSWRGAPYVYDESLHPTAWVGRTARDWLAARAPAAAPFFLKVSFHRPHSPYDPPARLLDATPASLLPPVRVSGTWDARFADPRWCGAANDDAWCGAMPAADLTLARRAYRANIRFVDEQVAAILETLSATGARNNTWVLFVSDHGDGQGDHNLFRKTFPWELSAHVPGLIAWPPGAAAAAPRGSSTAHLAELRDVFATVLDIAGAAPARPINGSSWACLVRDPSGAACGAGGGAWRSSLDLEHSTIFNATNHWNAIVSADGLKYIYLATTGAEMLHDLSVDPHEMVDFAGNASYAARLSALRAALGAQFLREGRGPTWVTPEGALVIRPEGTVYGPNFPSEPPPGPPQPPIAPCDAATVWETSVGGYYRSRGGAAGNLAPFAGLTFAAAQARCCADARCAGLDYDAAARSGFLKTNGMGGWTNSTVYIGSYKPGQACHSC
jgi:arylsulfatase A-like enzyme